VSYPTADARLPSAGWRAVVRAAFPFLVVGALWEAVAHAGLFHPRLFPPVEAVAGQFVRLTASGVLPHHAREAAAGTCGGIVGRAKYGHGGDAQRRGNVHRPGVVGQKQAAGGREFSSRESKAISVASRQSPVASRQPNVAREDARWQKRDCPRQQ